MEFCLKKKYFDEFKSMQEPNGDEDSANYVLVAADEEMFLCDECPSNSHRWIADTGASHHMTNDESGLVNKVVPKEVKTVKVGNGTLVSVVYTSDFRGYYLDENRNFKRITIKGVSYSPEFCAAKLFSITKALDKGMRVSNEGKTIMLTDDKTKICFDKYFTTVNGYLAYTELYVTPIHYACIATTPRTMKIQDFHDRLGHPHFEILKDTAKKMAIQLKGSILPCRACALAKARQGDVNKWNSNRTDVPGQRIYYDISSIQSQSLSGSRYWLLMVDEATRYKISRFIKTKDDLAKTVSTVLRTLNSNNKTVKYVRSDNAGENSKVEKYCEDMQVKDITFEYTAPYTPQQNGIVERSFAFLYNRVRAMVNLAGFDLGTRKKFWAECALMATDLDNIQVKGTSSSYERFHDCEPKIWREEFRPVATLAVVKLPNTRLQKKLKNKGTTVMFLGFTKNHPIGTFHFLNSPPSRLSLVEM